MTQVDRLKLRSTYLNYVNAHIKMMDFYILAMDLSMVPSFICETELDHIDLLMEMVDEAFGRLINA
ncbi:MAG: hypothetical protein DRP08_01100 [Candidatus Aenigmatarchaeota archaeon]|nr:MAG: hypothetical protein DRP08_01100 [Candidatus Aenigmarchaeota archaeon]